VKEISKEIQKSASENQNIIVSMSIEIASFEERKVEGGKGNVVFYKMQIGFLKSNKRWFLEKRYSDFDALDKIIKEIYPNLASLPPKTLFKLSDEKYIEDRRKVLNQYMKVSIHILIIFKRPSSTAETCVHVRLSGNS